MEEEEAKEGGEIEVDDEPEYEVDAILADEYRMDKKQNPILFYLINWFGDWANIWEPAENVGIDAITEYEDKKAAERGMHQPSKSKLKTTMQTNRNGSYDEEMADTNDDGCR